MSSTLDRIADRLAEEIELGIRRDSRGGLISPDFADDELTDEELESLEQVRELERSFGPGAGDKLDGETLFAMQAEVDELRSYAELARSITVNQKAVKLIEALDKGFERLG